MNAPRSISAEYLMGIKEGRELLKASNPDLDMMRAYLASTIATMREFSAGPVKDMLKGERDFWQNQIKLEILKRAGRR